MTSCNLLSLSDPCSLYCKSWGMAQRYGNAADGTRCKTDPSIFDVCIRGACKVAYLNNLHFSYVMRELPNGLQV